MSTPAFKLPRIPCANCQRPCCKKGTRGLCHSCYRDRAVSVDVLDQDGHHNNHHAPRLPEPTTARPGSEEKIAVLARRWARGEALFHPDDAGMKEDLS